jgi:hypothetical protein
LFHAAHFLWCFSIRLVGGAFQLNTLQQPINGRLNTPAAILLQSQ